MDFQLTEDHLSIQKWVHQFAEDEIRPVAPQYDESEEFPWPVLKKAAEVGLYGVEFYMETLAADPTGLMFPICLEETCWGCAGIALGIWGSGLPLATLAFSGTPEQLFKWAPLMFGVARIRLAKYSLIPGPRCRRMIMCTVRPRQHSARNIAA